MGSMSEKDPFAEVNPFLGLRKESFPRREPPNLAPAEGVKKGQEDPCEGVQDGDARLFLQAVGALPLEKKPSCEASGFAALKQNLPLAFAAKTEKAPLSCAVASHQNHLKAFAKHSIPALQTAQAGAESSSTEEHASDFARAMRDVRPLKSKGRDVPLEAEPPAVSVPRQQSFGELLESTLEFSLNFSEEYTEGHVVGLESLIMQKLKAGQYSPEAHLDLHGLNARQAFDAMIGFVRHSWHRGMRTLLLIPGRGRNSPDGMAILRVRVQSWLTQEPFKRVVLAFCTAKPVHGGPGSLYILLRKYKKKGKIYWERCPVDLDL